MLGLQDRPVRALVQLVDGTMDKRLVPRFRDAGVPEHHSPSMAIEDLGFAKGDGPVDRT
jgi:hypothetical protein